VTDDVHIQNILEMAKHLGERYSELLNDCKVVFGVAAKALNVYLKYVHCANFDVRFLTFVGFVIATEISPDEPSAVAQCDDLSNFASRRVSSLARKSTHLTHQRGMNCGF
jgi:hypothetical protein